ncbi:stage II sporulation protein M, partial [Mycolicibacterium poriferae]
MTSDQQVTRRLLRWRAVAIVADNARAYLALNVAMYGLFLAGFIVGLTFPHLSRAQVTRLDDNGTTDLAQSLIDRPWLFAVTILGVNVIRMSVLTIVLPSLVVPFAGIALFAYWVFTTGITLVPASDLGWVALIPHSLTLVIELQAYLVLLLGVYLLGRNWIRPGTAGADNRRGGYLYG